MKTVVWLTDVLKKLGGFFLLAMTILSCADVVGGAFGYPILGCEEMVGLMAALVLADMALLNLGSRMEHLEMVYKG